MKFALKTLFATHVFCIIHNHIDLIIKNRSKKMPIFVLHIICHQWYSCAVLNFNHAVHDSLAIKLSCYHFELPQWELQDYFQVLVIAHTVLLSREQDLLYTASFMFYCLKEFVSKWWIIAISEDDVCCDRYDMEKWKAIFNQRQITAVNKEVSLLFRIDLSQCHGINILVPGCNCW